MIQNVECLASQLDAGAFAYGELLKKREVPTHDAGRVENAAAGVARAIHAHRHLGERRRVEPFVYRVNARSRIRVSGKVGTAAGGGRGIVDASETARIVA